MNIKLKAFLLAITFVALPFIFLYILVKHPLAIIIVALAFIVYLVYNAVLDSLVKKEAKGQQ